MRAGGRVAVTCCSLLFVAGCGSASRQPSGTSSHALAGARTSTTTSRAFKPAGSAPEVVKVAAAPKFASPSPSAPVQSGTVQIAYRDITIEPDAIRVEVGSTIRWTNYDSVQANVTSVGGPQQIASKDFGEGGTFEVKLDAPGVIHYVCTFYPSTMNGTIEVVG
jgi:plastocyanin